MISQIMLGDTEHASELQSVLNRRDEVYATYAPDAECKQCKQY